MTVAELIAKLQAMPQDARVVTDGFDETYIDDVARVELRGILVDRRPPGGHLAPHDEAEGDETPDEIAVWINW